MGQATLAKGSQHKHIGFMSATNETAIGCQHFEVGAVTVRETPL